jgi:hypothetical protein
MNALDHYWVRITERLLKYFLLLPILARILYLQHDFEVINLLPTVFGEINPLRFPSPDYNCLAWFVILQSRFWKMLSATFSEWGECSSSEFLRVHRKLGLHHFWSRLGRLVMVCLCGKTIFRKVNNLKCGLQLYIKSQETERRGECAVRCRILHWYCSP